MAVKNPYAETHDWVYENELTSVQANQYVFRLLDGSTERPSMDMLIRKLKSVRLVRDSEMNGRKNLCYQVHGYRNGRIDEQEHY